LQKIRPASVAHFSRILTLQQNKDESALARIMVVKRGSGLLIQPLVEAHRRHICKLGGYEGWENFSRFSQ
jgi:predicted RNA-binding protein with PUA-like domain